MSILTTIPSVHQEKKSLILQTHSETNNNEHKVNIYIAPILLVLSLHYNCDGIHMCYNTDLFRHSVTMCRRSLMPFSICVTVLQHI